MIHLDFTDVVDGFTPALDRKVERERRVDLLRFVTAALRPPEAQSPTPRPILVNLQLQVQTPAFSRANA